MNSNKKNKVTHAWGIASLIIGIIGILSLLILPIITIPFSILAIIFSLIQKKYESTGAATAGLILGIISIILYVIIGFAFFGGSYSESGTSSISVSNTLRK